MVELQGKVVVSRTREEVFSILKDIDCWSVWWSAVTRIESPSGGLEKGQEFIIGLQPHKMNHTFKLKVMEVSPRSRIIMVGKKRGMAIKIQWALEETAKGCRVEEIISVGGPGMFLFRMLGQVEALGHMVRRNLNGLKNLAEATE